ncbi:MAG TPA: TonB family protein [Thermoanaerobaculia bacterium]|nr:TonB family protein [Thermoanaerobaculia bacterium]
MRIKLILLVVLVLAAGCMRHPAPVATNQDAARLAIAIRYVGVPVMNVYAFPTNSNGPITRFGYLETVSVLGLKGEWSEVRTLTGSGWVKTAEMIDAPEAAKLAANPSPRFLNPPAQVINNRVRGEIVLEAKVNTDGEVIGVRLVKNTTRNTALAQQNVQAMQAAKFYPMVQKGGQRVVFSYEHKIYY